MAATARQCKRQSCRRPISRQRGARKHRTTPTARRASSADGTTYTRAVTGRVFRRSLDPALPVAVEAIGSTIRDATGREYLDAAGGAIVVNIGHGRQSVA